MNKRKLGSSPLQISEVGLGCWQFGGDFGPIEAGKVEAIVGAALTEKIDFFDTADVYGKGASERYLGQFLPVNDVVVATKYGRGGDAYPDKYSLINLRDSVRRSQDRLQRDQIDLIQLHCVPTEVVKYGEIFDWLRTIQQEGHIAYFGASVETIEEAQICLTQEGLTSLQVIYNLFRQRITDEVLPAAKEKGVGIIVRLPLASGLLSGKYTRETSFAETDHRAFNRDGKHFSVGETFAGVPFDLGVDLAEELKAYVPNEWTMAQWAMRWILDHDAVATIIPGASSPEQACSNAQVSGLESLDPELHDKLYQFYCEKVAASIRGVY